MPIFLQEDINERTRLGIWHITEPESFFLEKVPLQNNITHPNKRLQHLAGRFLLQYLFPDFPYDQILIADSRKPYLPYDLYHFSISHTGDFAAAIVSSKNRVGIDIEQVSRKVDKVKHKFLHPEELDQVKKETSGNNHQLPLLTTLWSAKEAVFKWWSFGNVDFGNDIRLMPFTFIQEGGSFDASFTHQKNNYPLSLQYKIIDSLSLVWLVEGY